MDLIEQLNTHWRWSGVQAVEIVRENDFGNLILRDGAGRYWRLCPEELYCEVVTSSLGELDVLFEHPDFLHDWHMADMHAAAVDKLGALAPGHKYCLKMPVLLGGEYTEDNLGAVPLEQLLRFSGTVAAGLQ